MNTCVKLTPTVKPAPVSVNYGGELTGFDEVLQSWIIDGLFVANCAASLLVKPRKGDKVCFIEMDDRYYITQLLARAEPQAEVLIESSVPLQMVAPELKLTAFNQLELVSLNRIAVMGKNYVVAAANSMIQQTEHLIQQVGQFSLTAKGLLRLNAKQQVITAEEDVRIDGKRINMG